MIYHVYNRSIADYKIFNNDVEFIRMLAAIRYYQQHKQPINLSRYIEEKKYLDSENLVTMPIPSAETKIVNIIAYCLMPTHLHLILQVLEDNGIPIFMSDLLNSYARYFNIKHGRRGPLWEGKHKKVLVDSDSQLLHLTRYVHLNPVTAYIVDKPEDWRYSSYKEYISGIDPNQKICDYENLLDINPQSYKNFVEDRISYQRELAKIKSLTLE